MDNAGAKFVTIMLVSALLSLISITLIWGFAGLGIFVGGVVILTVLITIYTLIRDVLNKE